MNKTTRATSKAPDLGRLQDEALAAAHSYKLAQSAALRAVNAAQKAEEAHAAPRAFRVPPLSQCVRLLRSFNGAY